MVSERAALRLLLDTQIAVWAVLDEPRLGERARTWILRPDVRPVVSVATIWEIAIKFALGGRRVDPMPVSGGQARERFEQAGYQVLPVTARHAAAVDDLPPLHGDPFDRMLVAQALSEPMRLLTRDPRLKDYGALVELA